MQIIKSSAAQMLEQPLDINAMLGRIPRGRETQRLCEINKYHKVTDFS